MIRRSDHDRPREASGVAGAGATPPDPARPDAAASLTPPDPLFVDLLDQLLPTRGPVSAAEPITALGRFRLLRELGRGGAGVVYLAEDPYLPRPVALKVPRAPQLLDPAQRQRFLREAKAAARLDDPHVVAVHEVGEAGGVLYIAYAYCEGPTLAHWLRGHGARVPARDAAQLVATLAGTVHAAHRQGVLHRDLKPSNILLRAESGALDPQQAPLRALAPKVTDFGLAKLLEEGAGETATGLILGTPAYMAPEQAHGRPQDVGVPADVYGLGAILYELLTGRPPFRGATDADTLRQVVAHDPIPPGRLRADVPPDLEAVCRKCLEKEPRKRYPSAAALADDLRQFLAGVPTAARPLGPAGRAARWARRRPDLAGLTALAAVAVLAAVLVGGWLSVRLAVSQAETRAAGQVAAAQEFFALLERARQRRSEPRSGWTRESLAELGRAAALPQAKDYLPELRSEAAACLAAVDLRPAGTFSEDFPVYALAYSADGRRLALGRYWPDGAVGKVRLVDPDTGRVERELTYAVDVLSALAGKTDGCRELAFSPDGRWLVGSSVRGWLHRWDLTAGAPHAVSWRAHTRGNWSFSAALAFGLARPLLFTVGQGVMQCWDPADGWREAGRWEPEYPSRVRPGHIGRPAVDPASGRVAFSLDFRMHFLDGRTLRPCRAPSAEDRSHQGDMVASPGGRTLAAINDRVLSLIEADTGRVLRSLAVPDGETADAVQVTDAAFSPDGSLLATASEWSRHVRLWDVARGRLVADFVAGSAGSMRLAFRPGGRTLAVAADRKAALDEVTGLGVISTLALQPYPLAGAAVGPDGQSLACLTAPVVRADHWTQEVSCWSTAGGPGRPRLRLDRDVPVNHNRPVIALRPGGGLVFAAGEGLEYRPGGGGESSERFAVEDVKQLAFGPDGRLWAAAGHEVRAFALPGWREAARWANGAEDHRAGRVYYTVAPGAAWVLAGRRDGRLFLLDPAGRRHADWAVGDVPLTALALHEAAGLAVVGDENGRVRVARVPSGEVVADLAEAHRDAVEAAAVAPGGRLLATGGRDRAVRLWRADGAPVLTLPARGPVTMLAFGPGGEELFALIDGEHGVRRWHLGRLAQGLRAAGIDPGYDVPSHSEPDRSSRPVPE